MVKNSTEEGSFNEVIAEVEKVLAKHLGPIHPARIAVRRLQHGLELDSKGFRIGVKFDDRGLPISSHGQESSSTSDAVRTRSF